MWSDALCVAALLVADPLACGGVVVRAGAGPVRDLWLDRLRALLPSQTPWRRLPPGIADDRLLSGLDLAATLRSGRPVAQRGLLAEADGGVVVVPMAERLPAGTVAKLCAALDTGTVGLERDGLTGAQAARFALVLLDEGGEDEAVAEALADRMAFRIDLSGVGLREAGGTAFGFEPDSAVIASEANQSGEPPRSTRTAGLLRFARNDGPELGRPGATPIKTGRSLEAAPSDSLRTPPSPLDAAFEAAVPLRSKPEIDPIATLCAAADDLGIASLRGPLLAARIARLISRLDGRGTVGEPDVIEAARLVLAPRATRLPAAEPPSEPTESPSPDAGAPPLPSEGQPDESDGGPSPKDLDEIVLEAARAAIPPNLLTQLLAGGPRLRMAKTGRVGAASAAPRSGRPAGSRPGDPRRGRLDLIATLRAAAPWQRLRRAQAAVRTSHPDPHPEVRGAAEPRRIPPADLAIPGGLLRGPHTRALQDEGQGEGEREVGGGATIVARRIIVLPDDFRIKRLVQRSETTAIFCVDASGSAALERLAEAKGAVELLLAESYVRRDRVALIAFRGAGAQVVLAPTRSLVRAKRVLGGLPGGGGTPLAAGLDAATSLALSVRRAGGSPVLVLLTDGRANVARSGEGGRQRAGEEALAAARTLRALALPMLVIDTGARPEAARRLAEAAQARYIPLPHADAGKSAGISAAVRAVIG